MTVEKEKVRVYTEDEVQRILKDRVVDSRLEMLETTAREQKVILERMEAENKRMYGKIMELMQQVPEQVRMCREELEADLEDELEEKFFTRAEGQVLARKVDRMAMRVAIVVGVIVGTATVLQWLFQFGFITPTIGGGHG